VRNTDLAADKRVRRDYGRSVAGAAGRRIRPAAQQGDHRRQPAAANALPYFYDTNQPCNKRSPASAARPSAASAAACVLGTSDACIATHPSDMAVAMRCSTPRSRRSVPTAQTRAIPIADFHRLPGDTPHIETALTPGELITAVTLPKPVGGTQIYQKVRDRASYAFALVSVAAIVQRDGSGRVALGGVAHKPWRVEAAEARACRKAPRPWLVNCWPEPRPTPRTIQADWSSARSARRLAKQGSDPMKFDTPATPTRSTSSRSSARPPTASTVR
jgi:xanthine dehydrogenase YagS FAD-binding subunit